MCIRVSKVERSEDSTVQKSVCNTQTDQKHMIRRCLNMIVRGMEPQNKRFQVFVSLCWSMSFGLSFDFFIGNPSLSL